MLGREARRNALLVFASLAVAALVCEGYFRIFPPSEIQTNNSYGYVSRLLPGMGADGTVHWVRHNYPLAFDPRGYYRKSDGAIYYFKDQFGGRWVKLHGRKIGKRVGIVVGDSVTYGFGVRYEDSFVYRLGELLKTDFINLSVLGADSERAFKAYQQNADKIPHQLVIYGLHVNDLIEFATNYVAENSLLGLWIAKHSRFAEFLVEKWDDTIGRAERIAKITSPDAFENDVFNGNFRAILKLQAEAEKRRVPLVVAVLPVLVDLKKDTFRPVYGEIEKRLTEHGFKYVDLTHGLENYHDSDLWILPFDQHPNEIAHGIFANELRDYFLKQVTLR